MPRSLSVVGEEPPDEFSDPFRQNAGASLSGFNAPRRGSLAPVLQGSSRRERYKVDKDATGAAAANVSFVDDEHHSRLILKYLDKFSSEVRQHININKTREAEIVEGQP